jgi:leader peptidase (prepilin peptidase)/N-methyltransferase
MSIALSCAAGWFLGWFVNYLADVLPPARRLVRPTCAKCQTPYPWGRYLLLGRCSACETGRGWRSYAVQILLTVSGGLLSIFPRSLPSALGLVLLAYLVLVAVIDLEHRLILHPVSLFGVMLGLASGLVLRGERSLGRGLETTLIGGAVGFGIMLVFYFIGNWYARRIARRRGLPDDEVALGFGDVNLSGVLGLILGWPGILAGLMFAILMAGLFSLALILGMLIAKKYRPFTAIPYAPFLILGAVILIYL